MPTILLAAPTLLYAPLYLAHELASHVGFEECQPFHNVEFVYPNGAELPVLDSLIALRAKDRPVLAVADPLHMFHALRRIPVRERYQEPVCSGALVDKLALWLVGKFDASRGIYAQRQSWIVHPPHYTAFQGAYFHFVVAEGNDADTASTSKRLFCDISPQHESRWYSWSRRVGGGVGVVATDPMLSSTNKSCALYNLDNVSEEHRSLYNTMLMSALISGTKTEAAVRDSMLQAIRAAVDLIRHDPELAAWHLSRYRRDRTLCSLGNLTFDKLQQCMAMFSLEDVYAKSDLTYRRDHLNNAIRLRAVVRQRILGQSAAAPTNDTAAGFIEEHLQHSTVNSYDNFLATHFPGSGLDLCAPSHSECERCRIKTRWTASLQSDPRFHPLGGTWAAALTIVVVLVGGVALVVLDVGSQLQGSLTAAASAGLLASGLVECRHAMKRFGEIVRRFVREKTHNFHIPEHNEIELGIESTVGAIELLCGIVLLTHGWAQGDVLPWFIACGAMAFVLAVLFLGVGPTTWKHLLSRAWGQTLAHCDWSLDVLVASAARRPARLARGFVEVLRPGDNGLQSRREAMWLVALYLSLSVLTCSGVWAALAWTNLPGWIRLVTVVVLGLAVLRGVAWMLRKIGALCAKRALATASSPNAVTPTGREPNG